MNENVKLYTFESVSTGQPVPFVARLVVRGDTLNPGPRRTQFAHDKDDPILEFYDPRNPGPTEIPKLGFRVAEYYLTTLLGMESGWASGRQARIGLDLRMGDNDYKIDGASMDKILHWAVLTLAQLAVASKGIK